MEKITLILIEYFCLLLIRTRNVNCVRHFQSLSPLYYMYISMVIAFDE